MKFDEIDKGIDTISMPEHNEIYDKLDENQLNISQHELMNAIHQEFQRSFIRKLYPKSKWTEIIFWDVAGTLQQKYYDEMSLNQIIEGMKRYLAEHKMMIPIIEEVH